MKALPRSISSLLILLLMIIGMNTSAQKTLSLQEAQKAALEYNLEIQIATKDAEASAKMNSYGVAGAFPTISATASDNQQNTSLNQVLSNGSTVDRKGVNANTLNAGINASITLFNGWRIFATKKRLEALEQQNELLLWAQIQTTQANVIKSYYDVVRQQYYLETLEKSLALSQKRLDILSLRKELGLANKADVFQAQIDLNTLKESLEQQKLMLFTSRNTLEQVLNTKLYHDYILSDSIVVDDQLQLDSIMAASMNNPELLAADQQVRIQEAAARETAAQRYPSLRLNGAYLYNRSRSDAGFNLLNQISGPSVGLSLVVPLYNGSSFRRQQQAAQLAEESAELKKQKAIRDITAAIERLFETYTTALNQAKTAKETYAMAGELLQLATLRFEAKQATILELREAQKSFEDAGFRWINLLYTAKSAEVELKRISNRSL